MLGGLGIFLVTTTMDAVSYEYTDGKNVLTMEKLLTAAPRLNMEITEKVENDVVTVEVSGEIDGANVGEFETALRSAMEKAAKLVVDIGRLEYVFSAGLRVFLLIRKLTEGVGHSMVIRNVTDDVMEIFTVTGFVKLLVIE